MHVPLPTGTPGAAATDQGTDAPPHDPPSWMRGFHGAIVDVGGLSPSALRQLTMSRRSTGLGRLAPLVSLPGVPAREVPRATVAAPAVAVRAAAIPRQSVPDLGGSADLVPLAPPTAGSAVPVLPVPAPRPSPQDEDHPLAPSRPADAAEADAGSLADLVFGRLRHAEFILLPNRARTYAVTKRALDLVVATVLLALTAPLFLVLAILIRLDSPGPALFTQTRVTSGGREFRFFKFRTMYADARDRFPELYDYRLSREEFEHAYYKLADDPRNTRVGRWLRRTTLDELPNLLNVLTGDLSLVGPRPDLPDFVRLYEPEELCCLLTKAGLTGVAQVAGRSLLTVHERLSLDMRYIAQQTFVLDLRILWRTVVVVLSGRGAF